MSSQAGRGSCAAARLLWVALPDSRAGTRPKRLFFFLVSVLGSHSVPWSAKSGGFFGPKPAASFTGIVQAANLRRWFQGEHLVVSSGLGGTCGALAGE